MNKIHNRSGNITAIEGNLDIPFDVKRVYYLYDVPGGAGRGGHAHKELQQMIVAASGYFDVVLDDGIFEQDSTNDANLLAGEYASTIYFVPLTIVGNFPVTYREYLDYHHPVADANVALLQGRQDFWTDGGVYSWAIEQQKWCYKLSLKTEQRIVLRTPHLAGKIQNIKYIPLQHLRSSDPASPYHADGGVSVRGARPFFSVWA